MNRITGERINATFGALNNQHEYPVDETCEALHMTIATLYGRNAKTMAIDIVERALEEAIKFATSILDEDSITDIFDPQHVGQNSVMRTIYPLWHYWRWIQTVDSDLWPTDAKGKLTKKRRDLGGPDKTAPDTDIPF